MLEINFILSSIPSPCQGPWKWLKFHGIIIFGTIVPLAIFCIDNFMTTCVPCLLSYTKWPPPLTFIWFFISSFFVFSDGTSLQILTIVIFENARPSSLTQAPTSIIVNDGKINKILEDTGIGSFLPHGASGFWVRR